ncbi:hypothetical protein [Halomicrobium urmianum]|uniref:hypothetical protein n=1 Tax=Halomicrobium urmianum TaxID=1586233 RepID=UPI0027E57E39|nr:hypothetical protein [Halomicrobium urmianum]
MTAETQSSVTLHNVAETEPADWTTDGDRLCRVPASVRADLNGEAREPVRHPTHSEIRFVPESESDEIEVTLSAADRTRARIFWGSFRPWQAIEIDSTPETLSLSVPDRLRSLDGSVDGGASIGASAGSRSSGSRRSRYTTSPATADRPNPPNSPTGATSPTAPPSPRGRRPRRRT